MAIASCDYNRIRIPAPTEVRMLIFMAIWTFLLITVSQIDGIPKLIKRLELTEPDTQAGQA